MNSKYENPTRISDPYRYIRRCSRRAEARCRWVTAMVQRIFLVSAVTFTVTVVIAVLVG